MAAIAEKKVYDAVVVGSGITGGYAAMELTKKGLETLVLEAGRPISPERDYVEHVPPWQMRSRGLGEHEIEPRTRGSGLTRVVARHVARDCRQREAVRAVAGNGRRDAERDDGADRRGASLSQQRAVDRGPVVPRQPRFGPRAAADRVETPAARAPGFARSGHRETERRGDDAPRADAAHAEAQVGFVRRLCIDLEGGQCPVVLGRVAGAYPGVSFDESGRLGDRELGRECRDERDGEQQGARGPGPPPRLPLRSAGARDRRRRVPLWPGDSGRHFVADPLHEPGSHDDVPSTCSALAAPSAPRRRGDLGVYEGQAWTHPFESGGSNAHAGGDSRSRRPRSDALRYGQKSKSACGRAVGRWRHGRPHVKADAIGGGACRRRRAASHDGAESVRGGGIFGGADGTASALSASMWIVTAIATAAARKRRRATGVVRAPRAGCAPRRAPRGSS